MYFLTIIITNLIRNLLDLHFISAGWIDNGEIFLDYNSDHNSDLQSVETSELSGYCIHSPYINVINQAWGWDTKILVEFFFIVWTEPNENGVQPFPYGNFTLNFIYEMSFHIWIHIWNGNVTHEMTISYMKCAFSYMKCAFSYMKWAFSNMKF